MKLRTAADSGDESGGCGVGASHCARAHEVWRAAVGTWHRANVLFVCVPGARPPAPPATEGRKATC